MTVRKRKWRDKQARQHEKWMIHIEHTWPDGRKQTIRKVSPVQTKRGAEQYERELRLQLVSGQWKEEVKKVPTLAEFAEEFLGYQRTLNKPDTMASKEGILRRCLIPAFGKCRLDAIDERVIDAYKVEALARATHRGPTTNPQTVNQQLKLLGRMLRTARKWKVIREVPEITLLKLRKSDFDFLTFEEADAFLAGAAEHLPDWHPFMVVGIRTGLRVGEMVALRWREDVDFKRGRLRVQQSHSAKNGFTTTKNDKPRDVPLTWDALEALRVQHGRSGDGELVFPGDTEDGVLTRTITNSRIAKVAKAIGMRHIHNHVLRHTFASHAAMRGIPLRQIQEWLGHATITMTMRYAHLAEGSGDELIQRLAPPPADQAARSQHKSSTRKRPSSKSPPHEGVGGEILLS
ncbi:MAG: tyrosine-type recombinase/integrase [Enhygromyxa sp.]